MNNFQKQIKHLKKLLELNKELSVDEWNEYAKKNNLMSAITIIARGNVENWQEIKEKYINEPRKNIYAEIKKVRKKLNDSIDRYGIESENTMEHSIKINALINEYYRSRETIRYPHNSNMHKYYHKSYDALKSITEEFGEFPTIKNWNKHAKENNCLSSSSMQYISKLDWNKLRTKIFTELNSKL